MSPGPLLTIDAGLVPVSPSEGRDDSAGPVDHVRGEIPDHRRRQVASVPTATSLADVEREHIVSTLKQTRGVIEGPKGAATILNLHPNTLRSRIKKLGITKPDVRRNS